MAFNDVRRPKSDAAGAAGVGTLTAFIDQGSEFTGKLSFKDTVRIDGRFEGEIESQNTLIVGESGSVHADIRSEVVVVLGEVKGDIIANQQVTLHKSARVVGNLWTKALVVEEGAEFTGKIEMGKEPKQAAQKPEKDAQGAKAQGDRADKDKVVGAMPPRGA